MTSPRYLPALDGLRALSVLAVLGYHADLPHFQGGFLGVEVFFVVSGYLITALLLREQRTQGAISLTQFWFRRARRLLPALFTLLLAALVLALTVARESLAATRADGLAAFFYVSNWWQVIQRHSYFMDVDRPPLLAHLWSLAVEEQFYFFWPLAVALLGRAAQRWVLPVALLGGAASAWWMARLYDPSLDPTRLYIGTDTRLSGLLAGAALAVLVPGPFGSQAQSSTRLARVARGVFGMAGLGGLLALLCLSSSHDPQLYRGQLWLVDLASCALVSSLVAPGAVAYLLGAAPAAWVGRRSYGLYLWHWPIFAVTRPDLDLAWSGLSVLALRLGLTFAVAEICYRFIETPVRQGALLRLRARPLWFGTSTALLGALAGALVASSSAPLGAAPATALAPRATVAQLSPSEPANANAPEPVAPTARGVALDPAWPKTLTLLSDSVTLDLSKSLPAALPGWKVEVLGRPALMVKQVVPEFLNARAVGSVVVVGLAYNSLFERDRKNYERWSGVWDRSAERLLSDLKACGAKKVVWITLREPSPELVTEAGRDQYQRYAWFFPYVNERIRALAARHPELAIADWQAVSNAPDLTRDLIHLNPAGVSLMTDTVTRSVLGTDLPGRATP